MNLLVPAYELANAFLDSDLRPESQHRAGMLEIRVCQPHVPRLIREPLDLCLASQRRSDEGDEAVETHSRPTTQVYPFNSARRHAAPPLQTGAHALPGVGNIGIVALPRPVPVHPN